MHLINNHNKLIVGKFFLLIYCAFQLADVFHYHNISFFTANEITSNHIIYNLFNENNSSGTNDNNLDDLTGVNSICAICHFSSTILNYHISSQGILKSFFYSNKVLINNNFRFYPEESIALIPSRAPPLNS